jgi:glutamine synthetase
LVFRVGRLIKVAQVTCDICSLTEEVGRDADQRAEEHATAQIQIAARSTDDVVREEDDSDGEEADALLDQGVPWVSKEKE